MTDINDLMIRQCPAGGVMLDVGANHGVYTTQMAQKASRVFAFEPHPDNVEKLASIVGENVTIVQAAVTDTPGKIQLIPCKSNPGGHTVSETIGTLRTWRHAYDERFLVDAVTLDDFCRDITGIVGVKIDVEGAEVEVIAGALEMLARESPLIALETHQNVDLTRLSDLLRSVGYDMRGESGPARALRHDTHYLCERTTR